MSRSSGMFLLPADPQVVMSLQHSNDTLSVTIGEVKHMDAADGKIYAKSIILPTREKEIELEEETTEEFDGSCVNMDATIEVTSNGNCTMFII